MRKRGRPRTVKTEDGESVKTPTSATTTKIRERVATTKQPTHVAPKKTVIVTSQSGVVAWLAQRGITGELIPRVTNPDQVRGATVYGILPPWLACEAESMIIIDMPKIRPEQKGSSLTPEEMDAAGAKLKKFRVIEEKI
jgi:hypothetical protein